MSEFNICKNCEEQGLHGGGCCTDCIVTVLIKRNATLNEQLGSMTIATPCGNSVDVFGYKICPYCGAKMDKEDGGE